LRALGRICPTTLAFRHYTQDSCRAGLVPEVSRTGQYQETSPR
jgi:hypothetical protein